MNDGIYNNVRRPASDVSRGATGKADNKVAAGLLNGATPGATPGASDMAAASKPKSAGADQLHLSNVSKRMDEQPSFDRVKVDSIKKAIEDGNYPLDPRRIAESFHAIEQMISG